MQQKVNRRTEIDIWQNGGCGPIIYDILKFNGPEHDQELAAAGWGCPEIPPL